MNIHNLPSNQVLALPAISAVLAPFRVDLSPEQLEAIREYVELLLEWNKSINLTAIEDREEILARHFGESIFAASFLPVEKSRLADLGTGAGFPGLALKIACPGMKLTLFESNAKKRAFLTEASQRLGLADVVIRRERYEDFSGGAAEFDFICARALGDYHVLLPWSRRLLGNDGRIALWLGTEESIRIGRRKEFAWEAPIGIPESRRRVILVGRAAN